MGITSPQHDVLMKMKKPRLDNGDYMPYENGHNTESRGMEKSPLLANGYNPPPTHLNPMQFMALNHAAQQAAAAAAQHALLGSPGSTMHQAGLQAGLNLAGANHHGLASHSQASANYAAHHSAAAAAAGHSIINRPESDAVSKGSSSVDPMMAARSGFWENCRAAYEDVVKHLERLKDDRSESEKTSSTLDAKARDHHQHHNGSSASPVLNLSKGCEGVNNNASVSNEDKEIEHHQHSHQDLQAVRDGLQQEEEARRAAEEDSVSSGGEELPSPRPHHHHALVHHPSLRRHDGDDDHSDVNDDDDIDEEKHETSDEMERDGSSSPRHSDKSQSQTAAATARASSASAHQAAAASAAFNYSAFLNASVGGGDSVMLGSTENLLRNIQSLLKVAAENARQQDRQANYEKAELKMEILRERELRESIEKQMMEDQRSRVLYQKRLRKERRARRKLADQLELETKRRCQFEEALKTTSSETFLVISEKLNQEIDQERKGQQQQPSSQTTENNETDNTIENRGVYYKNSLLFTNAS
ncbi:dachshund-like protein [Daphnia sinensis]|uniref:Dachshund-like protein n=1 Tax=Daphnia sinensis TaxID=1820382 RepID=A0AAD5L525_9CRUS|nr:dachshund-like protein [Daphnia sinensis]